MDNVQRFIELSRQIESFFIHKRAILTDQKPELMLTEEINELKNEIYRKDVLLKKYQQNLNRWTSIVNDLASDMPNPSMHGNMPPNQMPNNMAMNQPPNMPPQLKPQMNHQMMAQMNQMRHPNPAMMGSPMNSQIQMGQPGSHQMPFNAMNSPNPNHIGLGPLAHLERTTAHIGINDNRR